jgi:hypothetical protein
MRKNWLIDRRTCLKGLGVALALPLLETMGWADPPRGTAWKPPVRLGFMYMPHGVIESAFWPSDQESFLTEPPPAWDALRPVIDQCLLLKGIEGVQPGVLNGAPHALELSTWLTATLPDVNRRASIHIAMSADQIAAYHIGVHTALPSLELATMPQNHKENQAGLNENYYSHCSFSSPTQPVPAETSPANAFKRLFTSRPLTADALKRGGAAADGDALDRSMLDLVLGGARDLRGGLSGPDQRKLDEYLDGIRTLERRVAAIEQQRRDAGTGAAAARRPTDSAPIEVAIPADRPKLSEYMQVMGDLMVLAFQTDVTRVSTLITSTPNGISYPELGFTDEHHSLTHHNFDPVKVDKITRINQFNIAQFAHIVKRMAGLREGDGTLLDHSIMMWGSGLEDGNKHTRKNLPAIIAGKGGGTIRPGRFVPDCAANQGDLVSTLLVAAGVPLEKPIGIGTRFLTELG